MNSLSFINKCSDIRFKNIFNFTRLSTAWLIFCINIPVVNDLSSVVLKRASEEKKWVGLQCVVVVFLVNTYLLFFRPTNGTMRESHRTLIVT